MGEKENDKHIVESEAGNEYNTMTALELEEPGLNAMHGDGSPEDMKKGMFFQLLYEAGGEAVDVSELELDKSTRAYRMGEQMVADAVKLAELQQEDVRAANRYLMENSRKIAQSAANLQGLSSKVTGIKAGTEGLESELEEAEQKKEEVRDNLEEAYKEYKKSD